MERQVSNSSSSAQRHKRHPLIYLLRVRGGGGAVVPPRTRGRCSAHTYQPDSNRGGLTRTAASGVDNSKGHTVRLRRKEH